MCARTRVHECVCLGGEAGVEEEGSWPTMRGLQNLTVPWQGTEPGAMAVKAQSPNHWTAKELLKRTCYYLYLLCVLTSLLNVAGNLGSCVVRYVIHKSDRGWQKMQGSDRKHMAITQLIESCNILLRSTGKLKRHTVRATLAITQRGIAIKPVRKMK